MRIDFYRAGKTATGLIRALLTALAVVVTDAAAEREPTDTPAPETAPKEQLAAPNNSNDQADLESAPPSTFEPSEKINADSSVSFPVDI